MTRILFGVLLFVTALVQATILPNVNPWSVSPNIVLVLIFAWASTHRIRGSLAWAFAVGLVLDTIGLDPLGSNALALLAVVVLASLAYQRSSQAGVLVPILLVILATVLHGIVLSMLRMSPIGPFILVQAVLDAVLAPFVFRFARRRGGRRSGLRGGLYRRRPVSRKG